ncbi:MAG: hypothetical protein K2H96_01795 [Muribaculaceae bacterium]|nr:hypothetical protein [Muribaculaceae bacterium]
MKSNENQNTFEALPVEVKNSALTTKQMGVLNVLYRMSTLETSKANPDGSFFASQAKLTEETGYSNNTIIDVRSNFDECGFITTQKGTWEGRMATTYILHKDVIMDWAIAHPRIGAVKQRRTRKGAVISAVNKCTDEETQTLRDEVKQLREVVTLQNQRISALEEVINKMCNGAVIGAVNDNSIGAVTDKCTTEPELKKEITNPIVTSSNPDMGLPICTREENDTDEGTPNNGEMNPSNADEGNVSDFYKIEGYDPDGEINKSQATANKASGSAATPQMAQTTTDDEKTRQSASKGAKQMSRNTNLNAEERINQLDALQLWKMNTPNVNPIELAKEVGELLVHDDILYQSHAYTKAAMVGCYILKYANDLNTLNEIEGLLLSSHIERYVSGNPYIDHHIKERRKELTNPQTLETSPEPHQSHADHSDEEIITNEQKRAQKRPDKAGEAMQKDDVISADLNQMEKANDMYYKGEEGAARLADKTANHIIRYIPKIETIAKLNWCRKFVNLAFEEWGRVLESNAEFYLDIINRKLDEREEELRAA